MDRELNASQIKDAVTTLGGTTIEGIYQLEDGKLRTALMNAFESRPRNVPTYGTTETTINNT